MQHFCLSAVAFHLTAKLERPLMLIGIYLYGFGSVLNYNTITFYEEFLFYFNFTSLLSNIPSRLRETFKLKVNVDIYGSKFLFVFAHNHIKTNESLFHIHLVATAIFTSTLYVEDKCFIVITQKMVMIMSRATFWAEADCRALTALCKLWKCNWVTKNHIKLSYVLFSSHNIADY